MPSHYLNQYLFIVSWTFRNKLQYNYNQNTKLFIHENASEKSVCEIAAMLSRGRWVELTHETLFDCDSHSHSILCLRVTQWSLSDETVEVLLKTYQFCPSPGMKLILQTIRYLPILHCPYYDYPGAYFNQINSYLPGQNGRHFADDMFKCIFVDILYLDLNFTKVCSWRSN